MQKNCRFQVQQEKPETCRQSKNGSKNVDNHSGFGEIVSTFRI